MRIRRLVGVLWRVSGLRLGILRRRRLILCPLLILPLLLPLILLLTLLRLLLSALLLVLLLRRLFLLRATRCGHAQGQC